MNLLFQVKGNYSLALAIVENLSLGTLAIVIALNLIGLLIPCVIVALVRVTSDVSFSPQIRTVAGQLQAASVVVGLILLPWIVVVVAVVVALFYRWRKWFLPTEMPRLVGKNWFAEAPAPIDHQLRSLWLEGRKRLIRDNEQSFELTDLDRDF